MSRNLVSRLIPVAVSLLFAAAPASAQAQAATCADAAAAGEYELAIELCGSAIGDGVEDHRDLVDRGVAYAMLGYEDRAIMDFERALELREDYARAHTEIALTYYRGNANLDLALRNANRAVELAPGEAAAHDARAHILVAMDRLEEGYQAFRRALRVGGSEYAMRVQTALKSAGHDPGAIDGRPGPGTLSALRACVVDDGCRLLQ